MSLKSILNYYDSTLPFKRHRNNSQASDWSVGFGLASPMHCNLFISLETVIDGCPRQHETCAIEVIESNCIILIITIILQLLLMIIIQKLIINCTGKWSDLLPFGETVLAKPRRGEREHNITKTILSPIVDWRLKRQNHSTNDGLDSMQVENQKFIT
jgi:hypothetical protein